jgi:cyclophilin family peptidyl-prolyl cis-trans isomerase
LASKILSRTGLAGGAVTAILLVAGEPAQAGSVVRIKTTIGTVDVEMYDIDKPETVKNFLKYIRSGRYKSSFFHYLEPGGLVQGGGFFLDTTGEGPSLAAVKPFPPIRNEFGTGAHYSNRFGTISMAKAGSDPNSATSNWFINLGNNTGLDLGNGGYTVFGKAISGIKVLKRFNRTFADNNEKADVVTDQSEALGSAVFAALPLLRPALRTDNLIYTDLSILSTGTTATLVPRDSRIETTTASYLVRGRARGNYRNIVWRLGSSGGFRKASGRTAWRFTVDGLKPGENVITIRAMGPKKVTAEARVVVVKR